MQCQTNSPLGFIGPDSPTAKSQEPASPTDLLGLKRQRSTVEDKNAHLSQMSSDYLYHLALSKEDSENFRDVKFVCIGGSNDRMQKFAYTMADNLGLPESAVQHVGEHKRYVIFKVGKVLIASHGMGGPSISILLNEIAKLLKYAEADARWIRLGTCGGVGLEGGTIAISEQSVNGALQPYHETYVLGKPVRREAIFDQELCKGLEQTAKSLGFPVQIGKTMCCDDFYEGQGRLDGAICDYTVEDKLEFLQQAHDIGVRNIEMESLQFGAFTKHVGVSAVTICSVLLNRLNGDQIGSTGAQLAEFEQRTLRTVLAFVKQELEEDVLSADS